MPFPFKHTYPRNLRLFSMEAETQEVHSINAGVNNLQSAPFLQPH